MQDVERKKHNIIFCGEFVLTLDSICIATY